MYSIMAENLEKEFGRKQLSYLSSRWSKVSKFTLQYFADVTDVTRANLFTQISDPENGKRMGIDALRAAAAFTGVKVDAAGNWTLVNGLAQQWPWKGAADEVKEAIKVYLKELHENLSSPRPFKLTKVTVLKNEFYRMKREYALVEMEDHAGNEMSAMLFADNIDSIKEVVGVFMESGVCQVTGEDIVLPPEAGIQLAHGPIPKPQPAPSVQDVPWNVWIPLVHKMHLLGIKPEMVEAIFEVAAKGAGASKASSPALVVTIPPASGIKEASDKGKESWIWPETSSTSKAD